MRETLGLLVAGVLLLGGMELARAQDVQTPPAASAAEAASAEAGSAEAGSAGAASGDDGEGSSEPGPQEPVEPDPEEAAAAARAAEEAADAYNRAVQFFADEQFVRAAQWFETAYRLNPEAATLTRALEAQVRTGHAIRTANLALRLRGLHGDDAEARALADRVLSEHSPNLVRLTLECSECALEVQGRRWAYPAAFLTPYTEYEVSITEGDSVRRHRVRGTPGQHIVLGSRGDSPSRDERDTAPPTAGVHGSGGLSPWAFAVGLGLTSVSAIVTIAFGVDTLSGVGAFEARPTPEAFERGEAGELRTNVMIGITTGLALVTLVLALLADWDGDPERLPETSASLFFDGRAGGLWVRTRL